MGGARLPFLTNFPNYPELSTEGFKHMANPIYGPCPTSRYAVIFLGPSNHGKIRPDASDIAWLVAAKASVMPLGPMSVDIPRAGNRMPVGRVASAVQHNAWTGQ